MFKLIYPLSILLFWTFVFLGYKTYQYFALKEAYEYIKLCVSHEQRGLSKRDWIWNIQFDSESKKSTYYFPNANKMMQIERKYWLTTQELKIVDEILLDYEKDMCDKYFKDYFTRYNFRCKQTKEEFFLMSLGEFLRNNERKYSSYECEEATVYYKMYLISHTYRLALRKDPYQKHTVCYNEWTYIKETLEKYIDK